MLMRAFFYGIEVTDQPRTFLCLSCLIACVAGTERSCLLQRCTHFDEFLALILFECFVFFFFHVTVSWLISLYELSVSWSQISTVLKGRPQGHGCYLEKAAGCSFPPLRNSIFQFVSVMIRQRQVIYIYIYMKLHKS